MIDEAHERSAAVDLFHQIVQFSFLDDLSYKGDTSTHAQGTDPKVALRAYGELPGIYLDACGGSRHLLIV